MRIRTPVAALAGALVALAAPPAHAAPPGPNAPVMHVLEVGTDDADDQAKAVTLALRHRVRESKEFALADSDNSLQVLSLALKCPEPPNATCLTNIATKISGRQYFWGTMKKAQGSQVTLDLHLWQRGHEDVHERFTFSDNLTEPRDPALERLADQMYQRLVFYGRVGVARLVAERALEGELFVNGRAQGPITHAQHELTLPPGEYNFEVRSGGRVTMNGRGRVAVTQVQEVRLVPVRSQTDAAIPPPVDVEPANPSRPADTSGGSSWRKPVGIVGIGLGGALLVAGAYASLRVLTFGEDEAYKAYRSGVDPNKDACDEAAAGTPVNQPGAATPGRVDRLCSSSKTLTTFQYVAYPVGALAAGAGLVLLLSAQNSSTHTGSTKAPRWALTPSAGPRATGLDFRLNF